MKELRDKLILFWFQLCKEKKTRREEFNGLSNNMETLINNYNNSLFEYSFYRPYIETCDMLISNNNRLYLLNSIIETKKIETKKYFWHTSTKQDHIDKINDIFDIISIETEPYSRGLFELNREIEIRIDAYYIIHNNLIAHISKKQYQKLKKCLYEKSDINEIDMLNEKLNVLSADEYKKFLEYKEVTEKES